MVLNVATSIAFIRAKFLLMSPSTPMSRDLDKLEMVPYKNRSFGTFVFSFKFAFIIGTAGYES